MKRFSSHKSGKNSQVFVHKKGCIPYKCSTTGVAAQRDFYSLPSFDNEQSLDDKIGVFENYISNELDILDDSPHMREFDPQKAAALVTHLSIRTAHFRDSASNIVLLGVSHLKSKFSDRTWLRERMGLDKYSSKSRAVKSINERIEFLGLPNISRNGMSAIMFEIMQNKFNQYFDENRHLFSSGFDKMLEEFPKILPKAHQKALENNIAPQDRINYLSKMKWNVYMNKNCKNILPDCVTIALNFKNLPMPYMFSDFDKTSCIIIPVSQDRLLVGSKKDNAMNMNINRYFAHCCFEYFVSGQTNIYPKISDEIGQWSNNYFSELMLDAFDDI